MAICSHGNGFCFKSGWALDGEGLSSPEITSILSIQPKSGKARTIITRKYVLFFPQAVQVVDWRGCNSF